MVIIIDFIKSKRRWRGSVAHSTTGLAPREALLLHSRRHPATDLCPLTLLPLPSLCRWWTPLPWSS